MINRLLFHLLNSPILGLFCLLPSIRCAAQDSIYSHWPQVRQAAVSAAIRQAVHRDVEALLNLPVLPAPKQSPAGLAEGNIPGWDLLKEARFHLEQRDYPAASKNAEQALELARTRRDSRLEMQALGTIGRIAREVFLGASLKAVPYHREALAIARALNDSAYIASQLLALADNYGQAGQNTLFLNYLDSAVHVLRSPATTLGARANAGVMFGCFLETQGDTRDAESIFRAALPLARIADNGALVENIHWQLYWLYLEAGNAALAEAALDSVRNANPAMRKEELYEPNYQLAKLRGDRDAAFRYLEQAYRFLGSEYTRRSAEQLAGWETRLRTREKELQLAAQIRLLDEQNRHHMYLYGLIALVTLLLLVSLLAGYQQLRAKQLLRRQNSLIEQQRAELQQLDQLKSRFFANMSHELRTPLTLILSPLQEALQDGDLSRRTHAMLQTAHRNGQQLLDLVNELLDLSKIRASRPDLQEQATVLYDFLRETVDGFQPLAESRGVDLHLDYMPDQILTLALDRQKILKILNNLLTNALKYTPGGGSVVLHAERVDQELILRVRDTGPGVHPDDLPHIFDLYYQSKRPEARPEGGVGLGLALARELAEATGGRLWVESEWGAGSAFFLALPIAERDAKTADPVVWGRRHTGEYRPPEALLATRQTAAVQEYSARLLVVEDNADLRAFLHSILPADLELTFVDNGRTALEYLENAGEAPDLILTDVMMPEMDGFQLVEALRLHDRWRHTPVILLTALAERDDRLRAYRIGIDDYLLKPFSPEELEVRIENALKNREARREWAVLEGLDDPADGFAPADAGGEAGPWLLRLQATAQKHLSDFHFNVDFLAEMMGMNRKTLYRKLRQSTGMSVNQYIQELRLQAARELLESGQVERLSELASAVGMRSADYLARLYRDRFGRSPAEFLSDGPA